MDKFSLCSYVAIAIVNWETLTKVNFDEHDDFRCLAGKVWRMNISAKKLLVVSTDLEIGKSWTIR